MTASSLTFPSQVRRQKLREKLEAAFHMAIPWLWMVDEPPGNGGIPIAMRNQRVDVKKWAVH